jgi:hypothetical protein
MIRKAKAVWRGMGRDGNGEVSTDSGSGCLIALMRLRCSQI